MQHKEPAAVAVVASAWKRKVSTTKARELEIPNRSTFESVGKRSAGIRFQRHGIRANLYGGRLVLVIEFDGAVQPAVAHRAARIIESHEGRDWHFRIRRYPAAARAVRRRFDSSRECSADT